MKKLLIKSSKKSSQSAFSIVELLVVIVIIGILVGVAIAFYVAINNKTSVDNLKQDESKTSTTATSDTVDWITIGTQVWAKNNLNVGTMVTGLTDQTNNGGTNIVEKYCYDDLEANCTTYGGLYQWDEAMKYVTTEGAQGICPVGSHIPTDNEWKILEIQLGVATGSDVGQVDAAGWRGPDQGTKLKPGGTSELNIPLAGTRSASDRTFNHLSWWTELWSSSLTSSGNVWERILATSHADVDRVVNGKADGFSVRCLKN